MPPTCPDCGVDHSPVTFLEITVGIDRTHPDADVTVIIAQIGIGRPPAEARDPGFLLELRDTLALLAGSLPGRLAEHWAAQN